MKPAPAASSAPPRENLLFNLLCNVAAPTVVLTWLSGPRTLGPTWGLLVALAFPVAYGVHDFLRRRRCNFISVIGFASVLITGGFGLLHLNGFWFALKDGAIPAIIGLVVLVSMRARLPVVQEFLCNPQMMNLERVHTTLAARGNSARLPRLLREASLLLALAFFISAGLNYSLARHLLKSPPDTAAFNAELGQIHLWSWPVIVVPSMLMMLFAFWRFLKGLQSATGLTLDELLVEPPKKHQKTSAASASVTEKRG